MKILRYCHYRAGGWHKFQIVMDSRLLRRDTICDFSRIHQDGEAIHELQENGIPFQRRIEDNCRLLQN